MARRPVGTAKLKVWTERATSEMTGPIKSVAYHLFMFVDQNDREQLLADMKEWHESAQQEGGDRDERTN